jgi:hypothetical protein
MDEYICKLKAKDGEVVAQANEEKITTDNFVDNYNWC